MSVLSARYSRWTWVAAAAAAGVFIAWVWVFEREIWPLGWLVLGTHELGHALAGGLSDPAQAAAGSVSQLLFPLILLAAALISKRLLLIPVALLWLGYSAADLSVYVGDAQAQALPLVGLTQNPQHDWAYLLSDQAWGGLAQAESIAHQIKLGSIVVAAVAGGLCLVWAARPPILHTSSHLGKLAGGGLHELGEQLRRRGGRDGSSDNSEHLSDERDFSGGRERRRWDV